jgi:hypothetical protein
VIIKINENYDVLMFFYETCDFKFFDKKFIYSLAISIFHECMQVLIKCLFRI